KDPKIARFVGVQNIIPGRVVSREGGLTTVEMKGRRMVSATPPPAEEVAVVIRGEDISLHRREPGYEEAENLFSASITSIEPMAPFVNVTVDCGCELTALVTARRAESLELEIGMQVW